MNLSDACLNCKFKIKCLNGNNCERLREFGLSEGTEITKTSEDKRNIICNTCGAKMVVSKKLGEQIIIEQ